MTLVDYIHQLPERTDATTDHNLVDWASASARSAWAGCEEEGLMVRHPLDLRRPNGVAE